MTGEAQEHFTGKWRFRHNEARELVVQVETCIKHTRLGGYLSPPPPRDSYRWRDARIEDITDPQFPLVNRTA